MALLDVALLSAANVVMDTQTGVPVTDAVTVTFASLSASHLCGAYRWRVGATNNAGCPATYAFSPTFMVDPTPPIATAASVSVFLVRGAPFVRPCPSALS